jgi:hypothetical protein
MRNILFIKVQTIKDRTGISSNIDEKLVVPEIKTAQDMYILPLLGTTLYERMLDGISAANLNTHETKLRNEYIIDTLVYYTLAEMPLPLSFQMMNIGAIRKSNANAETPSMSDLIDIANHYRKKAEFYAERMVTYLRNNCDLFPEYKNQTDRDIFPSDSGYSTSIFLD